MFSDELFRISQNIIEIYFKYLPFSEYYKDEIIEMISCFHYIDSKCMGIDNFTKELALIWAKNDIDKLTFKRENCKCDDGDYCDLCCKYNKNIYNFEHEVKIKNDVFELLINIELNLKKFVFELGEVSIHIPSCLNTAIDIAKENNIYIQDKLQNIYVLLYSNTQNIDFLFENKKIL